MYHGLHKTIKQQTIFNTDNIKHFLKQHIRMISEGSCDTEDWSNNCWSIQLFHHNNKLHLQIYSNRKLLF